MAPNQVDIRLGDISLLPIFNPDREEEQIPAVAQLKAMLGRADGLIIASPEYAHGISGPLKNALDWLVNGSEFPNKPIMLIHTSPRASHAQRALREVLTTMSGNIIEPATVVIPLLGSGLDTDGIAADNALISALLTGLSELSNAVKADSSAL